MPTDEQILASVPPAQATSIANRRVLRLAFGTALCLWFSQAVGWSLSFIAPIFTLLLLSLPKPAPGLKGGIGIAVLIAVAIYAGLALLPLLLHQRMVGVLLLGLILFHVFYFTAKGGAAVIGTLITIGLTLTVAIGSVSVDAIMLVANGAVIGAAVGVVFVWIAFALLPDQLSPLTDIPQSNDQQNILKPDPATARRSAMRSLLVVGPVALWFLLSPTSAAYVGVMIKVASMGQQVTTDKTRDAAASLMLSTAIGGIAAVIAWQALTIWPSLTLYTLLIALAGLVIGPRIFSGDGVHANAPVWSYGFLTMIIILAPAVTDSPVGSSAGAAFFGRLWMFAGATLYGVAAVIVFDALLPTPMKTAKESYGEE